MSLDVRRGLLARSQTLAAAFDTAYGQSIALLTIAQREGRRSVYLRESVWAAGSQNRGVGLSVCLEAAVHVRTSSSGPRFHVHARAGFNPSSGCV